MIAKLNMKISIPSELESGFAHIWSADLNMVMGRLKKEHFFWSVTRIEKLVLEYRKFLSLALISSRPVSMCNTEVDEVWHSHLLFTQSYSDFCQKSFGSFLHHEPADGLANNADAYAEFRSEYERLFGTIEDIWRGPWWVRVLGKIPVLRLCTSSRLLRLCTSTGTAKLCTSSGTLREGVA